MKFDTAKKRWIKDDSPSADTLVLMATITPPVRQVEVPPTPDDASAAIQRQMTNALRSIQDTLAELSAHL